MTEEDSINFSQVMRSLNSLKWVDTMKDEMKLMADNDVSYLVKLSEGKKLICYKYIFKIKRDSKGNTEIYKVRIVIKGFTLK